MKKINTRSNFREQEKVKINKKGAGRTNKNKKGASTSPMERFIIAIVNDY